MIGFARGFPFTRTGVRPFPRGTDGGQFNADTGRTIASELSTRTSEAGHDSLNMASN